jgi:hypothetical protein
MFLRDEYTRTIKEGEGRTQNDVVAPAETALLWRTGTLRMPSPPAS